MKLRVKQLGIGLVFVVALVAITILLVRVNHGYAESMASRIEDFELLSSLHNLFFIPILVAALLLGEVGGTIIALLAIVASSIASHGMVWPREATDWGSMCVRGAFFVTLGYLTARIAERVRANGREWHSLLQISRAINSSLDIDETLQAITRQSVELTSADACAIRLLNGQEGELKYAMVFGLSEQYQQKGPLTVHNSPQVQRVMRGEDVLVTDVRRAQTMPYQDEAITEGIISILSLPLRTSEGVIGLLNLYRKRRAGFTSRDRRLADTFTEQAAIAIQNARLYNSIQTNYLETVRALTRAIEAKDPSTLGHSERVAQLALAMARALKLTTAELRAIEFGAVLHDIGKIGLDEQTLAKRGHLSLDERMLMEMHPMIGKSIIEPVEFLRACLPIVLSHHERWDGGGYPEGLRETETPLLARIVGLVNAYDHIMHSGVETPFTHADTLLVIREGAGTRFDPALVELLATVAEPKALPEARDADCAPDPVAVPDSALAVE